MKRSWWITISLVLGFGIWAGLYMGLPEARDWLPALFSARHASAADSIPYAISLIASAGIVLSALLFLIPAAIFDAMKTNDALATISAVLATDRSQRKKLTRSAFMAFFDGSSTLERVAEEFSSALIYASSAAKPPANAGITGSRQPAARSFGSDPLVGRALFTWLYRDLAHWNIGLTALLALVAVIQSPGGVGVGGPALIIVVTGLAGSLLVLGLTGLSTRLRTHQADRLCDMIDEMLGHHPWHDEIKEIRQISKSANTEVAAAVSKSLKKPLDALSGEQTDGLKKLTDSVLKSVKAELQDPLRQQTVEMQQSIKTIGNIVSGLDKEFKKTIDSLAAQLAAREQSVLSGVDSVTKSLSSTSKRQADAFSKEISELMTTLEQSVEAHEKTIRKLAVESLEPLSKSTAASRKRADKQYALVASQLDGMGKSITSLVTELSPSLSRIAEGQEAFLASIEKEATAAEIIKQSSANLSAAAQASRETMIQFVALAENLTEIGRAMQQTVGQIGKKGTMPPPGTGEELSDAIRRLKKMTDARSLPKL